ncbi:enoyl-CoA hydratase/isomerase family protein [Amycolatopsis cynarae]|uniref:Enoyl-CoA hydratase/isomerase family protein n=1 Tax=Amycolatopsis cynarae TaxID=2995223 RepID=A0ABY7B193_9PSEU|nr:enoyl-CoA hydratase/isomerase family protein [Amycolatopsis sp. HUAS 11-8]WAL65463.1 enoyl-CoA hydratase/isomerase family protein [Amycolatopsis sp. HUAS 11-8]
MVSGNQRVCVVADCPVMDESTRLVGMTQHDELTPEKWAGLVRRPDFAEYSTKFRDFFAMRRRDGIIELRLHHEGGPYAQTFASHNAWGQAWHEVGNDPENQVLILTGTGDLWFDHQRSGEVHFERTVRDIAKLYEDAEKLLENFVFGVDMPTIAAVNGPGPHTEVALACDITICTEDASFVDPHFLVSTVPGDGQGLTFQELMGTKRAAYHMYTGRPVDARRALEYGMVSEVVPRERLLDRAWELAEMIMRRPRAARQMTHAITSRPWKRRVVNDFGFQLRSQEAALLLDGPEAGRPPSGEPLAS